MNCVGVFWLLETHHGCFNVFAQACSNHLAMVSSQTTYLFLTELISDTRILLGWLSWWQLTQSWQHLALWADIFRSKKLDDISDILEAKRRFLFIKYIQIFGRDFCMIHSRPKLTLKNAWKVSLHTWKFAMSWISYSLKTHLFLSGWCVLWWANDRNRWPFSLLYKWQAKGRNCVGT